MQNRIAEAAPIIRDLREKAGLTNDISDEEICTLRELFNTWEALISQESIKTKEELYNQLIDYKEIP